MREQLRAADSKRPTLQPIVEPKRSAVPVPKLDLGDAPVQGEEANQRRPVEATEW
jgi:hypothetical protein